ncbi:hypothetical protein C2G38_2239516 [Gigaspora rosea]|uniref:RNI-like protein n=1 Tax=Gigaspora rosea TaxID=44941 RepID=A0A397W119_9GLOM|nr:hypothetical protein C2G38_2239516 [Gigaspora rosea]
MEEQALLIPFNIALPNCPNTTSISDLLNLGIKSSEDLANSVAETLCTNTTLTSLNLSQNYLGSVGEALARALYENIILTLLSLGANNIGITGGNDINDEGGKALAEALCTKIALNTLELNNNKLSTEGGEARQNNILNRGGKAFAKDYLHLNHLKSKGSKALVNALCKNTTLTFLNLSYNYIDPEGGKSIGNALCKNIALTSLNLSNNNIRSEGGKALTKALYENTTLTSLNVSYNNIGCVEELALVKASHKSTNLTSLNVDAQHQQRPKTGGFWLEVLTDEGEALLDIENDRIMWTQGAQLAIVTYGFEYGETGLEIIDYLMLSRPWLGYIYQSIVLLKMVYDL